MDKSSFIIMCLRHANSHCHHYHSRPSNLHSKVIYCHVLLWLCCCVCFCVFLCLFPFDFSPTQSTISISTVLVFFSLAVWLVASVDPVEFIIIFKRAIFPHWNFKVVCRRSLNEHFFFSGEATIKENHRPAIANTLEKKTTQDNW